MEKRINEAVEEILAQFSGRDQELVEEVRSKIYENDITPFVARAAERLSFSPESVERVVNTVENEGTLPESEAIFIAETIVRPILRPVLKIRDNTLALEFFAAADSNAWRSRLIAARTKLDAAIPSVGRIEVTGLAGFDWLGTGWLIADDIVVTNRHVAREFARRDGQRFVFRQGVGGLMTCRIDFLEEFERSRSLEFAVLEILWISPTSDSDIAFMRVVRNSSGNNLPRFIPLSSQPTSLDQLVVTIGYPARDDQFPDQDLARRVFGDVYDKKRLAPGQILESPDGELLHDCSTLGGNSGSVVLDLETGEAVALHYAGLLLEANYAVPANIVKDRLRRVIRGEFAPVINTQPVTTDGSQSKETGGTGSAVTPPETANVSSDSATFIIPLQVTVSFGSPVLQAPSVTVNAGGAGGQTPSDAAPISGGNTKESALEKARQALRGNSNVANVRLGYRFKDNWITDEEVIVVEVRDRADESVAGQIPEQFDGVGVEIRSIPLLEKLRAEGIAGLPVEERVAKGAYRKPTDFRLREVRDQPMTAIFHVSPDSGFPNLRDFIARTQNRITATMYEFKADHILNALVAAIKGQSGRKLKMVTQKNAEMVESINALKAALNTPTKKRFEQIWASVGNASSVDTNLLFPRAYHIKVAVRDGKEFWLSSGNWKNSGQPNIDPAGNNQITWTPLRNNNREWHAVIDNQDLAGQFEKYIEYDFSEARRVPLPEALQAEVPDLFVSEEPAERELEAPARYFDPLIINRPLRIQPLLSPDNYIEYLTGMIEEAEHTIYLQNQSFNLLPVDDDGLGDNEPLFYEVFDLLSKRQSTHDVKIIFRDLRQFGDDQRALLERLKKFGFNMDNVKLQKGCHTKGVIVDSKRVLLGSHNLTNQGALYNRDASLLVYDEEVARYYQAIFLFDWENLARQQITNEIPSNVRAARVNEATPGGMQRVSLTDLFYDLIV